jgi:hypothetical protein
VARRAVAEVSPGLRAATRSTCTATP